MLGFRVADDFRRPANDLVEKFRVIPTAIISDNMNRVFAGGSGLRPFHGDNVMCGSALTVRTRPGDNLMVHKALDIAKPGDIIVVDASGDMTNAIIGEIMLRYAMSRSLGGFVIDGAIRDTSAILSAGFPVFASGVTHRGPYKDGPGEIGVPVSVGGMVVSSGDIVIGDTDGLIAVPQSHAEEVLALAIAQQDREAAILQSISDRTIDRSWIDQTLKSKGV
ncbi:RraA family protein [Brucella anthropi]|uniref:RraA family protein n=1 Tax=Brucella anthropi TaxID=529 RepID=UPI00124E615F|nr:RraA family protein [Brucella anthropi]KAB2784215.1 RraA family protein [Brucella anthropi]KAB2793185.1 RraA family protein [Brucella anthropi]